MEGRQVSHTCAEILFLNNIAMNISKVEKKAEFSLGKV